MLTFWVNPFQFVFLSQRFEWGGGGGVIHMKSILANCFEFTVFFKLLLEFISDELVFLIGFLKKRGGTF